MTPTALTRPPSPIPATRTSNTAPTEQPDPTVTPTPTPTRVPEAELPAPRFAAHFVASDPEHAGLLPSAPNRIQIQFDFTLARNSNISVIKDGDKLTLHDMQFAENRLEMSVALPEGVGAGTYHVLYRACWPDHSCHDGEFAFSVATP